MEILSFSSRRTPNSSGRWAILGSVDSPNFDSFSRVREEVRPTVYQECHGSGPGSCSRGASVQDCRGSQESSQEYLDAVEKMEPEVEDLARRIVDNLDIDISSPDGDVDVF